MESCDMSDRGAGSVGAGKREGPPQEVTFSRASVSQRKVRTGWPDRYPVGSMKFIGTDCTGAHTPRHTARQNEAVSYLCPPNADASAFLRL